MPLYALFYDTVPDHIVRRQPFRAEHLALAERAHREGKLLLAGALEPPDAALLVFRPELLPARDVVGDGVVEERVERHGHLRHGFSSDVFQPSPARSNSVRWWSRPAALSQNSMRSGRRR